jgi:hypothetical protein
LWPFPLRKHKEELVDKCGSYCIGVQLACACHQHGPGNSTEVAQSVTVNSMLWKTGKKQLIKDLMCIFRLRLQYNIYQWLNKLLPSTKK